MTQYVLHNGKPKEEPDYEAWKEWISSHDLARLVELTIMKDLGCRIETRFYGFDLSGGKWKKAALYQTEVTGGTYDEHTSTYCTLGQAKKGHFRIVSAIRETEEAS